MRRTNWRRISSKLDRWAPFLMLVLFGLLLGPIIVSNAFTAPSGWNWFMFGLWVFVVVGQTWQCVKNFAVVDGVVANLYGRWGPRMFPSLTWKLRLHRRQTEFRRSRRCASSIEVSD